MKTKIMLFKIYHLDEKHVPNNKFKYDDPIQI